MSEVGQSSHEMNEELMIKLKEANRKIADLEMRVQQLQIEKQTVKIELEEEVEAYTEIVAQRDYAMKWIGTLESESREKHRRIHRIMHAFQTSYDLLKWKVSLYPVEDDQTVHTISRDQVVEIWKEEYEIAVSHAMEDIW